MERIEKAWVRLRAVIDRYALMLIGLDLVLATAAWFVAGYLMAWPGPLVFYRITVSLWPGILLNLVLSCINLGRAERNLRKIGR